ncbi:MAG: cysteine peptidase family C39 domain-containing protein, partial [Candidatus Omnitrophica bacterium]|nr:cysteine peptidase family C39 domain-containing protein [Candidatus Omnitrophota bacterium]
MTMHKNPEPKNQAESKPGPQEKTRFQSSFKAWIRIVAFIVVAVFLPEQAAQAVEYDWRVLWSKPGTLTSYSPNLIKDPRQLDIAVAVRNILKDISGKPVTAIKISPTLTINLEKPLNISKQRIEEIYNWLAGRPCGAKALYDFLAYKGVAAQEQDIAVMALTTDILSGVLKPEGNPKIIKSSLYALSRASEFFGAKLYPVKFDLKQGLTPKGAVPALPFIAHFKAEHYILVTRITDDRVYYADEHKEEFLPKDKFLDKFSGYALVSSVPEQAQLLSDKEAQGIKGANEYGYQEDTPEWNGDWGNYDYGFDDGSYEAAIAQDPYYNSAAFTNYNIPDTYGYNSNFNPPSISNYSNYNVNYNDAIAIAQNGGTISIPTPVGSTVFYNDSGMVKMEVYNDDLRTVNVSQVTDNLTIPLAQGTWDNNNNFSMHDIGAAGGNTFAASNFQNPLMNNTVNSNIAFDPNGPTIARVKNGETIGLSTPTGSLVLYQDNGITKMENYNDDLHTVSVSAVTDNLTIPQAGNMGNIIEDGSNKWAWKVVNKDIYVAQLDGGGNIGEFNPMGRRTLWGLFSGGFYQDVSGPFNPSIGDEAAQKILSTVYGPNVSSRLDDVDFSVGISGREGQVYLHTSGAPNPHYTVVSSSDKFDALSFAVNNPNGVSGREYFNPASGHILAETIGRGLFDSPNSTLSGIAPMGEAIGQSMYGQFTTTIDWNNGYVSFAGTKPDALLQVVNGAPQMTAAINSAWSRDNNGKLLEIAGPNGTSLNNVFLTPAKAFFVSGGGGPAKSSKELFDGVYSFDAQSFRGQGLDAIGIDPSRGGSFNFMGTRPHATLGDYVENITGSPTLYMVQTDRGLKERVLDNAQWMKINRGDGNLVIGAGANQPASLRFDGVAQGETISFRESASFLGGYKEILHKNVSPVQELVADYGLGRSSAKFTDGSHDLIGSDGTVKSFSSYGELINFLDNGQVAARSFFTEKPERDGPKDSGKQSERILNPVFANAHIKVANARGEKGIYFTATGLEWGSLLKYGSTEFEPEIGQGTRFSSINPDEKVRIGNSDWQNLSQNQIRGGGISHVDNTGFIINESGKSLPIIRNYEVNNKIVTLGITDGGSNSTSSAQINGILNGKVVSFVSAADPKKIQLSADKLIYDETGVVIGRQLIDPLVREKSNIKITTGTQALDKLYYNGNALMISGTNGYIDAVGFKPVERNPNSPALTEKEGPVESNLKVTNIPDGLRFSSIGQDPTGAPLVAEFELDWARSSLRSTWQEAGAQNWITEQTAIFGETWQPHPGIETGLVYFQEYPGKDDKVSVLPAGGAAEFTTDQYLEGYRIKGTYSGAKTLDRTALAERLTGAIQTQLGIFQKEAAKASANGQDPLASLEKLQADKSRGIVFQKEELQDLIKGDKTIASIAAAAFERENAGRLEQGISQNFKMSATMSLAAGFYPWVSRDGSIYGDSVDIRSGVSLEGVSSADSTVIVTTHDGRKIDLSQSGMPVSYSSGQFRVNPADGLNWFSFPLNTGGGEAPKREGNVTVKATESRLVDNYSSSNGIPVNASLPRYIGNPLLYGQDKVINLNLGAAQPNVMSFKGYDFEGKVPFYVGGELVGVEGRLTFYEDGEKKGQPNLSQIKSVEYQYNQPGFLIERREGASPVFIPAVHLAGSTYTNMKLGDENPRFVPAGANPDINNYLKVSEQAFFFKNGLQIADVINKNVYDANSGLFKISIDTKGAPIDFFSRNEVPPTQRQEPNFDQFMKESIMTALGAQMLSFEGSRLQLADLVTPSLLASRVDEQYHTSMNIPNASQYRVSGYDKDGRVLGFAYTGSGKLGFGAGFGNDLIPLAGTPGSHFKVDSGEFQVYRDKPFIYAGKEISGGLEENFIGQRSLTYSGSQPYNVYIDPEYGTFASAGTRYREERTFNGEDIGNNKIFTGISVVEGKHKTYFERENTNWLKHGIRNETGLDSRTSELVNNGKPTLTPFSRKEYISLEREGNKISSDSFLEGIVRLMPEKGRVDFVNYAVDHLYLFQNKYLVGKGNYWMPHSTFESYGGGSGSEVKAGPSDAFQRPNQAGGVTYTGDRLAFNIDWQGTSLSLPTAYFWAPGSTIRLMAGDRFVSNIEINDAKGLITFQKESSIVDVRGDSTIFYAQQTSPDGKTVTVPFYESGHWSNGTSTDGVYSQSPAPKGNPQADLIKYIYQGEMSGPLAVKFTQDAVAYGMIPQEESFRYQGYQKLVNKTTFVPDAEKGFITGKSRIVPDLEQNPNSLTLEAKIRGGGFRQGWNYIYGKENSIVGWGPIITDGKIGNVGPKSPLGLALLTRGLEISGVRKGSSGEADTYKVDAQTLAYNFGNKAINFDNHLLQFNGV